MKERHINVKKKLYQNFEFNLRGMLFQVSVLLCLHVFLSCTPEKICITLWGPALDSGILLPPEYQAYMYYSPEKIFITLWGPDR